MKSSVSRKADLVAARKAFAKSKEPISLEDLASLWGVSKARFVNVRNTIPVFPEPVGKQGNALLYPSLAAIDGLIRFEARHDKTTAARSAKVAKILGNRVGDEGDSDDTLSPQEMLTLARAGAEIEKRRREQGQIVLFAQVQETAAQIFGLISNRLGKLSDSADPNGRLPPATRVLLDNLGKDLLLQIYAELGDMLDDNADSDTSGATKARKRPGRAGRTRVRRKPA